jgi:hypothetical protein
MEADTERATAVQGSPSPHVFIVLGLNAVASMIDMFGFADPAHPSWRRHAARGPGVPGAHEFTA